VEELAEVLAVDFNAGGGVPKLKADWRWEDNEEAVLSACSSLVSVVIDGDSRVVQFSHFSVKEFLTSDRLARSPTEESRFHIRFESAHTILAQASLSVLLRLDEHIDRDSIVDFPLARYAADHWIGHVEFENVLAHVNDGVDRLFDPDKPHLVALLWLRDLSDPWKFRRTPAQLERPPLYYAVEMGHRPLVVHVLSKRPQDLNVKGRYYGTPFHAAISKRDIEMVRLLLANGADVTNHGEDNRTPLHLASKIGFNDVVRLLLSRGVDVDTRNDIGWTALHLAVLFNRFETAKILLKHNTDVGASDIIGQGPLHLAAKQGHLELMRLLLEHGCHANARDYAGRTPFDLWKKGYFKEKSEIGKLLLEHMNKQGAGRSRTVITHAAR